MLLLKEVVRLVRNEGYQVGNLDATILCQRPKLAGFISAMRENIAACCEIPVSDVSVKATTEEKLGFTGSGAGFAVHAVAWRKHLNKTTNLQNTSRRRKLSILRRFFDLI